MEESQNATAPAGNTTEQPGGMDEKIELVEDELELGQNSTPAN